MTASAGEFETGLDWSSGDELSRAERDRLLEWYRHTHGIGTLDLVKFVPFLIEHDTGSLKRYRRHVAAIATPRDGVGLPQAAVGLLFLHLYCVIANERGVLYEVVASRAWGAGREDVMQTMAFAFLEAGPRGMNAVAELADGYLQEWAKDEGVDGITWPEGWGPDPAAFRSGLDPDSDEFTAEEVDTLAEWHRAMCGTGPEHVRFLAGLHPTAYKTHRIRYEAATGGDLPAQMFPLFALHLATVQGRIQAVRRSARMARNLGVRRHIAVQALWWGLLYGGTTMPEALAEEIADVFAGWD